LQVDQVIDAAQNQRLMNLRHKESKIKLVPYNGLEKLDGALIQVLL